MTNVTVMEKRRNRKANKNILIAGQKVINLFDGETYFFISGKSGKTATVATEELAKKANTLRVADEKSNPMLAGKWFQYLLKNEKDTVQYDNLITEEQYEEATNTPANKSLLTKLEKSEIKREKLAGELDAIQMEIGELNQQLVASIQGA